MAREVFNTPNADVGEVVLATAKISLKHFLEDMYSVANYAAVLRRFPVGDNILEVDLKKVYPDFDDSAWFASRLAGRGALRNIATHRRLPTDACGLVPPAPACMHHMALLPARASLLALRRGAPRGCADARATRAAPTGPRSLYYC